MVNPNTGAETWVDFPSVPSPIPNTAKIIAADGSRGFDYRLLLVSGTAEQEVIYWDNLTTVQSIYN